MQRIKKYFIWLNRQSRVTHTAIGILLLLTVFVINYFAGVHISLSMLFLLPICYFTWFVGFRYGIFGTLLCVLSVVLWRWQADIHEEPISVLFWPAIGRVIVFLFVVFILARLKEELIRQKKVNEELLYSYEKIKNLSQIKDDFTARVSHDLRAPLAAIKESVALVLDGFVGTINDEQRDCLNITKRSIDRLRRLIDSILDFSKLEKGKREFHFEKNNLTQILNEVAALYRPLAIQKGLELKTDFSSTNISGRLDKDAIHQVLDNLVSNAIKFTTKGSVTLGLSVEKSFVKIFVSDTGLGIPTENLERLFKPFERLLPLDGQQREGTGLGLAISKQIVMQHGGEIRVASKPREGTCFSFTLPLDW